MTTDTIPHPLDRIRQRAPTALVCTACLVILATRPESYARSGLTDAQRLSYVCAECRADDLAAARRAEAGRTNLARARARAARQTPQNGHGRVTETSNGGPAAPDWEGPSATRINIGDLRRVSVTPGPARARLGGRPRFYPTPADGNRVRQRAYRARRRAGAVPVG